MILGIKNVSAKEIVYTNNNGIELDINEYNFFKKLYGQVFLQYLDEDTYNQYLDIDFENPDIETSTYLEPNFNLEKNSTRGSSYSTPAKSITVGKVCGALCRIVTTATWLGEPNIKSYDVIGSYLAGPTRISTPYTVAYSSEESNLAEVDQYGTNGFGSVVKIPTGTDVVIAQSFAYLGTGTVYSTYQHAMSTTTLTIAQKFNISPSGFGGVLDFYDEAFYVYDNMNGVDITF